MCHKPCGQSDLSLCFLRMCPHGLLLFVIYGFRHKDACVLTMWRTAYGDMM